MPDYYIPAAQTRIEYTVVNSRFIATASPAFSVEEAREFIQRIKEEYSDASHNVPAYVIGHGASVTAHCSDDGEPSGTAGRPALAVLQGSGLGDIAVVVTRYFGGTKLGKGGLVRAYGDGVRKVLEALPLAQKLKTETVMLAMPYNWLERLRRLAPEYAGQILDEEFTADITMTLRFPSTKFPAFQSALKELSHGQLKAEIIESGESILPVQSKGLSM